MHFQYLTLDNTRLRYAHQPKEGAATVLLLSPFPQSIMAFQPIWQPLSHVFNIYALDLPGFGRSEGGLEHMNLFAQAKILSAVIESLGIQNPHIVGPDVGCPIALAYAAASENVASLMVGDGPATYPLQAGKEIERMTGSSLWRFIYALNTASFMQTTNKLCYRKYTPNAAELADYQASYQGRLKLAMAWFASYHQDLPKLQDLLPSIDKPVKIFWGDQDVIILPETAQSIQHVIPQSEIQLFAGAGHFSYQDDAALFADMIIEWVNVKS